MSRAEQLPTAQVMCSPKDTVSAEYNMFSSSCAISNLEFSKLVIQQQCISHAIYQYLFIIQMADYLS